MSVEIAGFKCIQTLETQTVEKHQPEHDRYPRVFELFAQTISIRT